MAKKNKINDPVFYNLANAIADILKNNNKGKKVTKKQFTEIQKTQVERMMELEEIFKKNICLYKQSNVIYSKFLLYIKVEKGNILMARPYFRETSETFGKYISPAFKVDNTEELKKFHINYKFIMFVLENWRGNLPKIARKAWEEHCQVRQNIIENSMPLAINMAMRFFKSVPEDHLTLMDLINASILGLTIGVDKWVGPFSTVFRSVCIGRMKSHILEIYNQTLLHYYPSDKKIIYKANLLKYKEKIEDPEILLAAVNQYLEDGGDKRCLTQNQLQDLLNGANVFCDYNYNSEDGSENSSSEKTIYNLKPSEDSVEEAVEEKDALTKVLWACEKLDIIEKKIIKLKGVDL